MTVPTFMQHLFISQMRGKMWKDRITFEGTVEIFPKRIILYLPEISSTSLPIEYQIASYSACVVY
jgi:hypothetical protein